ncbi:MAG: hypothetical protein IPM39_13700 [Chloroflexi bacterium]|nr:hypothetical protein [Chloroflexota bacterium]
MRRAIRTVARPNYHGNAPAAVSDQRLISPPVVPPAGEDPVVLKFWHAPNLEANGGNGLL